MSLARFSHRILLLIVAAELLASTSLSTVANEPQVRVNSVGFPLRGEKQATIEGVARRFVVVEVASGAEVYRGKPQGLKGNTDLQVADFSELTRPGEYRLVVDGQPSAATFAVANSVFNQPFDLSVRAMYLWRCGTEVHADYAGHTYHYGPCHLDDASTQYVGETGDKHKDGVGGWHDAGDHNKYVINGAVHRRNDARGVGAFHTPT